MITVLPFIAFYNLISIHVDNNLIICITSINFSLAAF